MSKTLECYFDVGSPASYLAWTQLPGIASRHNAGLVWKPMLLGGVFQATGNQSPAAIEAKGRYSRMDMQRFARRYGVTLNHNPYFPVNTLHLMRGAVAFLDTPRFDDYLTAVFNALWVDEQDMGQPEVVAQVLSRAGFDPQDVMARASDQAVKDRLKAITTEAVERGVFGAPTLFVDNEMFFGQDRLWMVEEALA
ncbi:2-hydroxychromene-2-carboxylate isomerase [Marinobacter sp. M1N3S26]|uniref:2-hydroxychromene-2-carboxylate isomerase n=1 Tax=Marinobacter sp. M1N3S26 TaxID=3382299 RepID=UPI00387B174F